jgi:hypothetical protein
LIAAWAAVFLLAAWIIAGWIWDLAAPAPYAPPLAVAADSQKAADAVAARHWFGSDAVAPGDGKHVASYQLLGAMTGSGNKPGFAIISETGKPPMPVVEGEEFAPGVRLERVLPRAVEVRRQGATERLELPEKSAAGGKS